MGMEKTTVHLNKRAYQTGRLKGFVADVSIVFVDGKWVPYRDGEGMQRVG